MVADVGLTLGALLLGVLIASTAYAVTIVQTYIYFDRFLNDMAVNKMTVWVLLYESLKCHFKWIHLKEHQPPRDIPRDNQLAHDILLSTSGPNKAEAREVETRAGSKVRDESESDEGEWAKVF
ncbi:hypothetical protein FB451DRAFT_1161872 [Mycena latifolia]|nr:hypothetical protein FB451DRAFT_1161872 [Mycena latifolia]